MLTGAAEKPSQFQSSFKFYLRSPEERLKEKNQIVNMMSEIAFLREKFSLAPFEVVFLFVVGFLELRSPGSWETKTGKKEEVRIGPTQRETVAQGFFTFLQRFRGDSLMSLAWTYRPRHMPAAIFDVLNLWALQKADLCLVKYVPSAQDMLEAQCEGYRYLTINEAIACAGGMVDGQRDSFEFVLHDLAHAHQYFKNSEEFVRQKAFFRQMQSFLNRYPLLKKGDADLCDALEYLISDMNSHSAHLKSYLYAQLIQWLLRREGKSQNGELSESSRFWLESQLVLRFKWGLEAPKCFEALSPISLSKPSDMS